MKGANLSQNLPYSSQEIIDVLVGGKPILVFDSDKREGETDIFFLAKYVTNTSVRLLRQKGGGMIFLASDFLASKKLGLPFANDIYESASNNSKEFEILSKMSGHSLPYDSRSSFSIFLNHKETFTGITDYDRALTAKSYSDICESCSSISAEEAQRQLCDNFRIPGHVPVCIADSNLLQERQGHTELIVSLLSYLNLPTIALGCEMISDAGHSLSLDESKAFALDRGYLFLEGRSIMEACQ